VTAEATLVMLDAATLWRLTNGMLAATAGLLFAIQTWHMRRRLPTRRLLLCGSLLMFCTAVVVGSYANVAARNDVHWGTAATTVACLWTLLAVSVPDDEVYQTRDSRGGAHEGGAAGGVRPLQWVRERRRGHGDRDGEGGA
jgi:hypothetical protein